MNVRIVEPKSLEEIRELIRKVGADPYAVGCITHKAVMRLLFLEGIDNRAANIVKQEMLSLGGEAAVARQISCFKRGRSNLLIAATPRQMDSLLAKMAIQPFGLKEWAKHIELALSNHTRSCFALHCRSRRLELGARPVVMGILNITPDSFSDGGKYFGVESAIERALAMEEAGAGIIDIGGESTRPGAPAVPQKEEILRVVPVIKALSRQVKVPISIDTYKPDVARAALDAGACIVNDITALRYQKGAMAAVVKHYRVPVILMHMQGTPRTMQKNPRYRDVIGDISGFFAREMASACSRGIDPESIVLDPGIGFGKTIDHNLEILRRLKEFTALGRPLLVGASRKFFIGRLLSETSPENRVSGSLAAALWAAMHGAHILRVHDVKETVDAVTVLNAVQSSTQRE